MIYAYIICEALKSYEYHDFTACRYGELVASNPWKAIIACILATMAGGAGLLRYNKHIPFRVMGIIICRHHHL
jgi:hypothetical protein